MSLKGAMATKQGRDSSQKADAIKAVQTEEVKRLNVNVSVSKFKAFKSRSAADGKEMSELVNAWIDDYLSE